MVIESMSSVASDKQIKFYAVMWLKKKLEISLICGKITQSNTKKFQSNTKTEKPLQSAAFLKQKRDASGCLKKKKFVRFV